MELNAKVAGHTTGMLTPDKVQHDRQRYRDMVHEGEQTCPAPDKDTREPGQRGRLKRSQSRALLDRLSTSDAPLGPPSSASGRRRYLQQHDTITARSARS